MSSATMIAVALLDDLDIPVTTADVKQGESGGPTPVTVATDGWDVDLKSQC